MKAVIPAAGRGTRMGALAKAVPKELLPVVDRPAIQYVVQEAADAGVAEALLVTSPDKRAIEDHFTLSPQARKDPLLTELVSLLARVKVRAVHQMQQRGLGDAVSHAREFAGQHAFLCMLGDTIFSGAELPARQLAQAYKKYGTCILGVEEVSPDKVDRYGIVAGEPVADGVLRVTRLVEKPSVRAAPSRLAIAARYVLTPGIFTCLEKTPPGRGGEIQLTDALAMLAQKETIHAVLLRATRHDLGSPADWLDTNLFMAQSRKRD